MIHAIVCIQEAWLCEKYKSNHKGITAENTNLKHQLL